MKTFQELRESSRDTINNIEEGAEVYTVSKGVYTRKVDGATADRMKKQGWKLVSKESVEEAYNDDDLDYKKVTKTIGVTPKHKRDKRANAAQPAAPNKSAAARRKAIERHQELIRNKKKDPYQYESVDLEEGKMKEFHAMVKKGMTAAQIAKKIGMKEKDVAEFMKGMNEAKEYSYTVVHAKKGKVVVTAPTSYDAAQKAAKQWKLKSTGGVDAYLMKEETSVELDEAYQQFLDKSPSNWGEEKVIAYGTKKGYKVIGVCGHGNVEGIVLFGLDASDKSYVGKEAKVKTGQTVFRYATRNSMAGDIFPLVKIDVKKGLLYNLSQKSSDGEVDYAEFESKGIKLRYLRLAATANLRDITGFEPGFGSMKESTAPKTLSDIRTKRS
jgi:predicted transcriptional regulator